MMVLIAVPEDVETTTCVEGEQAYQFQQKNFEPTLGRAVEVVVIVSVTIVVTAV